MKYIVMECHEGYAVLMDEESRFVTAANLHYEVGQTVTEPVIMNEGHTERRITFTAGKLVAAAACLVLFASAGMMYYSHNLKPHSTVVISSEANVRIEVNQKGKVIHIISDSESGKELLKNYSGKGKDKLTVANEIIGLELEKGYISSGDTIDFYVSSEDENAYDTFKSDLENSISDINVNVHGVGKDDKPEKPKAPGESPEPPKPDKGKTPEKPAAGKEEPVPPPPPAVTPPAHDDPPAQKADPPKKDEKADKPAPPPAAEPKAPEKHDEKDRGEAEKPEAPAKPAKPGEGKPSPPEHDPHEKLSAETEISGSFTFGELNPTALLPEAGHDMP